MLPDAELCFLLEPQRNGIDYTQDWSEEFAAEVERVALGDASRARVRAIPSPRDIDLMEPSLKWITRFVDRRDRQLVYWAAYDQGREPQSYVRWTKVKRRLQSGHHPDTLKRRYRRAIDEIALGLNNEPVAA